MTGDAGASRLVLLRHGQSTANAEGLFTGLLDVGLSQTGVAEAHRAAAQLSAAHIEPNTVFASELRRATITAQTVVDDLRLWPARVLRDWRLDERNYGSLTGLSKAEVRAEYGDAQFLRWRRSVSGAPPPMTDAQYETLAGSPLFGRLPAEALTRTESLTDVQVRVRAFFAQHLVPLLRAGGCVLVVAHGNSLRALCGVLEPLDDTELERLNIPTGYPLVYSFDETLRVRTRTGTYLNTESAHAAAELLAHEGGT
ncbi:hypothetical protein B7R54_19205 [Subtercola boreus]|uniref:2,3-bisphosphoglycerate-dependent phosphoglycerate mutase n=2 Tax=Subtercola boreus TaxID=120213 RepID=A0A3E0VAL1_9MICO|nr:hypothetical protein B7R54_19205 [Subtercola boreus]TQL46953.1 2,3-bisphosphoglycerate-dependent phosphoglycerate mutase [Subtercola boreus]